jgi:hypothetical protein
VPVLLDVYFFELEGSDPSGLIGIVFCEALVYRSEVGKILVLGESEADLEDKAIDLCVELDSEKGHQLYKQNLLENKYLLIFN